MKFFFTAICLFGFSIAECQTSLVINSSFENHSSCPTFGAQWNLCTGWNNVNMNQGVGMWGTPDYFHACGSGGVVPPNTFSGPCSPHTGSAMMGVVLYNTAYPDAREYLSTQLSSSMQAGTIYTVSFWITNGTGPISPWTIKNIGIHFSSSALTQSGFNYINVVPQCEITTNVASTSWVQYSFTVNPTSNWSYLTVGSFRQDVSNSPTQTYPNMGGNPSAYANYFIDDIEVSGPEATWINEKKLSGALKIYPSPFSDNLTIEISDAKTETHLVIINSMGQIQYSGILNSKTIDLEFLRPGIYYAAITRNETTYTQKVIKE
jgi:hypothetical protein